MDIEQTPFPDVEFIKKLKLPLPGGHYSQEAVVYNTFKNCGKALLCSGLSYTDISRIRGVDFHPNIS